MKNEYLECGKIINTHGVKGAVKIESYCNTPSDFSSLPFLFFKKNGTYEKHRVLKSAVYKNHVI